MHHDLAMTITEFDGKVAVITGGAAGIGRAMARRFGSAGMKLVLADIETAVLDATVAEFQAEGIDTTGVVADVSKRQDIERIAAVAMEAHGGIHLVCNNAGVSGGGLSWEVSEADWKWILEVDLWSVIHGVGVFTPLIEQSGGGHIVNTASMAGVTSPPFMSPYNVAKHGVVALSESMFHELAFLQSSVGVSVLCPGWVRTQIAHSERNRPTEGAHAAAGPEPEDLGEDGPAAIFRSLVDDGIDPAAVADLVFDAVSNGRFYVLTHPAWNEMVRRNTEIMLAGDNPVFSFGDASN